MQRDRGADDAGAEHDRIGACHGLFLAASGDRTRPIYGLPATKTLSRPNAQPGGRSNPSMKWLGLPAAALTLIGRHGTLLAAISVFVGLAVPVLAAAFKPYLGEAIIVMLTLAFLRVDPAELRKH